VKTGDADMDDRNSTNSGVKRLLPLENESPIEVPDGHGAAAMITDGSTPVVDDAEDDKDIDRTKRSRKAGAISPSNGSAGACRVAMKILG
jgi:hypothetical protein